MRTDTTARCPPVTDGAETCSARIGQNPLLMRTRRSGHEGDRATRKKTGGGPKGPPPQAP